MLGAPHPSHQATDGRSLRLDHGRPEDATNPTTNTTLEPDRGAKGTVASEGVGRWDRRAHTEHAGLLVTAPALPVPGRPTPTRHSTGAPMPTITWGAQVASQQRRARPHPSNLVHESRPADPQHRMTSGALTGGAGEMMAQGGRHRQHGRHAGSQQWAGRMDRTPRGRHQKQAASMAPGRSMTAAPVDTYCTTRYRSTRC